MQHKINQFLGEKGGQTLRAEIYSDVDGYNIKYFVNGNLQTTQAFPDKSIRFVEEAAENWISGIKVLKG